MIRRLFPSFLHPDYNVLIGGELKKVHESAANQFLLKDSQWFNINTAIASRAMKDVFNHYKKYHEKSRKQTKYIKDNFSFDKMGKILKYTLNKNVISQVPLKLPKLKTIKLPKFKKVEA